MVTKIYKVYGKDSHRQKMSFNGSIYCNWSKNGDTRIIEILNSDVLGHNDFSILRITRNTYEEVDDELQAQLDDGIFECCNYGKVEEIIRPIIIFS